MTTRELLRKTAAVHGFEVTNINRTRDAFVKGELVIAVNFNAGNRLTYAEALIETEDLIKPAHIFEATGTFVVSYDVRNQVIKALEAAV